MENPETKFVDFIRGCHHPKLTWIMTQLVLLGVEHQIGGMCLTGPVLQVKEGQIETAFGVLNTHVGMMNLGGTLTDDAIKVADLVDEHPFFETDTDIEDLAQAELPQAELPQEIEVEPPPVPPVPAIIADEVAAMAPAPEVEPWDEPKEPIRPPAVTPTATEEPDPFDVVEDEADPIADEPPTVEEAVAANVEADPFDDDDDELWGTVEVAPEIPEHPELDYLKADKVLVSAEVQYAGVNQPIQMYEVSSSNLSRIGATINQKDQTVCNFYGEFKGGTQPYRYGPVTVERWHEMLSEAVRAAQGRPEASVGSLYHHLIKLEAEEGRIKCQRLVDTAWVIVPPKKDRVKQVKDKVNKKNKG